MKVLEDAVMTEEMKIGMGLSANCPFLVRYKDIFASNDGDEFYIVMELCEGGDLFTHLKSGRRLTEVVLLIFSHGQIMC
jgi:serine/threonine protein kinase